VATVEDIVEDDGRPAGPPLEMNLAGLRCNIAKANRDSNADDFIVGCSHTATEVLNLADPRHRRKT
jgi:hypothetical protein